MLFAEAIRMALQEHGMEVVAVVGNGHDAIAFLEGERPDVILMDVGLPDRSGIAVGREILQRWPDAKVLALTALDDPRAVDEAVKVGFRGYLTKDTSVSRFVSSIDAILDGQMVLPHRLGPAARRSGPDDGVSLLVSQLTSREREVLGLLVEGADGRTIASRLGISRNTVRTHVQNILMKLQVHSRLEAAALAVRHRVVSLEANTGAEHVFASSRRPDP
jgi:two-component system nitrate/nitrite response regulator NarL